MTTIPIQWSRFNVKVFQMFPSKDKDFNTTVPTNNMEANVYKKPEGPLLVSHLPMYQPRENPKDDDPT